MKRDILSLRLLLALVPLAFMGVFYFYPLVRIFVYSFAGEGAAFGGGVARLFTGTVYLKVIGFTFWQAALSTLLTVVLALPAAWLFGRFDFFGKSLLQALCTVPFVMPTVVVATAMKALLGPAGLVNQLAGMLGFGEPLIQVVYSFWFILAAHVFYNFSVVARVVGAFWSRLDPSLAESARMLGASGFQVFFRVTLPLLLPAVITASLLVFIFCFSSFGVILILGGPGFATLEVEIYRQALHLFNLPVAAALSLLQILFTFLLMWAYTRLQARRAVALDPVAAGASCRPPATLPERVGLAGTAACILLFVGAPLAALLYKSLWTASGFALTYYTALLEDHTRSVFFVPPWQAVRNSMAFALASFSLALALGMPAAYSIVRRSGKEEGNGWQGILDPVFMLPLSTSAVTLGFGFIIALDRPPLNLRNSWMLVPLAHALVAFPFVVRCLLPALRSIPESLREAAVMLGATPAAVFRHVDLPVTARALVVGAIFAFTVSLGEFGATAFTARPDMPTMPVVIYRFLGQPGALNLGQAMSMSSLLMVVTAVGFVVMERLRPGPTEF